MARVVEAAIIRDRSMVRTIEGGIRMSRTS